MPFKMYMPAWLPIWEENLEWHSFQPLRQMTEWKQSNTGVLWLAKNYRL